jgi:hypothetical protein
MKIGHPKDFWGGVLFVLIGLIFAFIARGVPGVPFMPGYSMGTPARMGPGFFPFYLGVILVGLGIIICIQGVRSAGGPDSEFPKFHWAPILWVLGATCIFGIILKATGMLIAGFLLTIIASMGNPEGVKWKSTIILAAVLVIFCALVFVAGLKLPIPLCPDIESLQNAIKMCRG